MRATLKAQLKAVDAQIAALTPAPKVTWTEINGLKWSSILEGRYQNLDLDGTKPINGIIQKSKATEECKAIGGELPTKEDFENLAKSDYKKLLPGMGNDWFWSSSVFSVTPGGAYVFNGYFGDADYGYYRGVQDAVVCVGRR